jgi:hypothetical protein
MKQIRKEKRKEMNLQQVRSNSFPLSTSKKVLIMPCLAKRKKAYTQDTHDPNSAATWGK